VKDKNFFVFTFLISFFLRFLVILFFGDKQLSNEWGVMLNSLVENNMLSIREIEGKLVPNLLMPPLYVYFLFFFNLFIKDLSNLIFIILFFQLIFSVITIYFFFFFFIKKYSLDIARYATLFFSIFPLNVYSVGLISSATLQLFLIVLILYFFLNLLKKFNNKNILLFSFFSGLLILLRGEFIFFYFFFIMYFFLRKKKIKIFFFFFIIFFFIFSFFIKNFIIFFIFSLKKSFGYNLLKGNNPLSDVDGYLLMYYNENINNVHNISPNLAEKLSKLKYDQKHDLIVDEMFLNEAIKNIVENKFFYTKLYIKKFFSFVFFDLNSDYPRYYNVFHILPKLLLSISTIFGLIVIIKKKDYFNFFLLYYFLSIFIFSFFFILPRYSLVLLPFQIFISIEFLKKLMSKK